MCLADRVKHVGLLDRRAGARLLRHLVMEAKVLRFKSEKLLNARDHFDGSFLLLTFETVVAGIKVTNHFKHERASNGAAIEASRTGRWGIPITPGPDGACGINGHMLCNVGPAELLRVVPVHPFDGLYWRPRCEVSVVGPEGMVNVDLVHLPF